MSDSQVVYIEVAPGRITETGLWCRRCSLPSGFEWEVVALGEDAVGPIGTLSLCTECESPL